MPPTIYTYSTSGDTSDGTVLASCLKDEVNAEGGINETCTLIQVGITAADNIDITMSDAVDGGEETLLDAVVAAHSETNCDVDVLGFKLSPVYNGSITKVVADFTHEAAWGERRTHQGIMALRAGEVIGFTACYNATITAGTADCFLVLDTVAQNGTGQGLTLNTTNGGQAGITFAAPIAFVDFASLGLYVITDAAFAPVESSMTVAIYTRET